MARVQKKARRRIQDEPGVRIQPSDHYLLLLGQEEEDIIINLFSIPLGDHSPDLQLPKGLFCPPVEHMGCE
jgi:hypothetical protein